jgi:predicted small integral membrane protein
MDYLIVPLYLKAIVVGGLAAWLSLIALNNSVDPGTNITLLRRMFQMDLIKADPEMGNGLEHRALLWPWLPRGTLIAVIVVQIGVAFLLWRGAWLLLSATFSALEPAAIGAAITAANLGLLGFGGLWLVFMCGGLWFGYWMKQGQVQQVHMNLLIIAILTMVLVNAT